MSQMDREILEQERQMATGANARQVGGDHYRKQGIEHWDYILANNIPYMEAQIIKYVGRWRDKGGLEDLRKAQHFLEKLIESEVVDVCSGTHVPQQEHPHPDNCLCDRCVKVINGEVYYKDGVTVVPDAVPQAKEPKLDECGFPIPEGLENLGPENTYMSPGDGAEWRPKKAPRDPTMVDSGEPTGRYVNQD